MIRFIKIDKFQNVMFAVCPFPYFIIQLMSSICLSPKVALTMLLRFNKGYFKFYRLPVLPILPVNSIIFTILPVNLKPGKSSTLHETRLTAASTKTLHWGSSGASRSVTQTWRKKIAIWRNEICQKWSFSEIFDTQKRDSLPCHSISSLPVGSRDTGWGCGTSRCSWCREWWRYPEMIDKDDDRFLVRLG